MIKQRSILALTACSVAFLACITLSNGQTPIGSRWWPSEWGADDERGAVLIRTGHAQLWMKDNDTYGAGEPGINMDAGRWITDRKVSLIGADNWASKSYPTRIRTLPAQFISGRLRAMASIISKT